MEHVREPNPALRRHMAEAGWNGPALAAALLRVAVESGVQVRYDRTTVAHWLAGTQPRPPGPGLLVEAFTRRLGRPVSEDELGIGAQQRKGADGEAVSAPDPVRDLLRLHPLSGAVDPGRAAHPVLYQVRALPGPRPPRSDGPGADRPGRIGPRHVRAVRELTAFGIRYYDAYGGAPARSVLAAGLREQALPWLRRSGNGRTHTELLVTTAQLVRVLGRTYADDRLPGEAQRHHQLAYQLADEADDPIGRAMALRDQSTLAGTLHNSRYAGALAAAALAALPADAPPGVRAFVLAQYAVAAAQEAGPVPALRSLEEARRLAARLQAENDPTGYPEPALLYQVAQVHRALHDPRAALRALRASLRIRPTGEYRTIGLSLLEVAHLELDTGDVHRARATRAAYLDLPQGPASGLAHARLIRLEARLTGLLGRTELTRPRRP
ncbi:hypothetical protein ACFV6F_09285 [Kitasatospora phosalacinea]|uniref:hypothetical protein n=1 Tax=Kitasatospora phosalacinea TaxID=2065 RepID=UPI003660A9D8